MNPSPIVPKTHQGRTFSDFSMSVSCHCHGPSSQRDGTGMVLAWAVMALPHGTAICHVAAIEHWDGRAIKVHGRCHGISHGNCYGLIHGTTMARHIDALPYGLVALPWAAVAGLQYLFTMFLSTLSWNFNTMATVP